jgi:hypothetical protein
VAIGVNPNLIVAATDLAVVLQIRRAMRNADAGALEAKLRAGANSPVPHPPLKSHPTPTIEPRKQVTPTPRIEPRVVYHPYQIDAAPLPPTASIEVDNTKNRESPIRPPWRMLPSMQSPQPVPELKVVKRQPDVCVKGTVFDVFI